MNHVIVWATDGSAAADAALPTVQELARTTSGRILVVYADQVAIGRVGGHYPVHVDEVDLQEKVRGQVEQLAESGFDATLEIAHAVTSPADAVADAATRAGATFIVVGTRGHGPLAGAFLGSVAQRLLHVSHCPVVAVPARLAHGERAEAHRVATHA